MLPVYVQLVIVLRNPSRHARKRCATFRVWKRGCALLTPSPGNPNIYHPSRRQSADDCICLRKCGRRSSLIYGGTGRPDKMSTRATKSYFWSTHRPTTSTLLTITLEEARLRVGGSWFHAFFNTYLMADGKMAAQTHIARQNHRLSVNECQLSLYVKPTS